MSSKITDLPTEYQIAIAKVATQAARLEYHIEHTVDAALHDRPATAKYLLKNLAGDRLVDLLKASLLDCFPTHKAVVEKLISEIRRLKLDRNTILHWTALRSDEPSKMVFASVRPYREFQASFKSAADIETVAADLEIASAALIGWQDLIAESRHESSRGIP